MTSILAIIALYAEYPCQKIRETKIISDRHYRYSTEITTEQYNVRYAVYTFFCQKILAKVSVKRNIVHNVVY